MTTVRIHIDDEDLKAPLAWSLAFHSLLLVSLAVSTLVSQQRRQLGRQPGRRRHFRQTGEWAGRCTGRDTASPPRSGHAKPRRGHHQGPLQIGAAAQAKGAAARRQTDSGIHQGKAAALRHPAFETARRQYAAAAKRRSLRPGRLAFGSLLAVPGPAPSQAQSQFNLGGAATTGGFGFTGPGGGGDFGGRFSWYVDAVRNRVSSNWLQSTVDPSVRFAPRAVVTFDILRNGSVANVQILQSSGNASVDNSAVRAILGSNPLNPLPGEYSGSKVSVEFWFDFKR